MIIISDNQSLTRDALVGYVAGQPSCFATGKAALTERLTDHPDAVVVLDFALFDFTSPENFLIYLRRFPQAHWLFLSTEFTEALVRLLGSEEQVSFLTKDCTREDVLHALWCAQRGQRTVCASVADLLAHGFAHHEVEGLTPTETEILALIARGLTSKAIAAERCSSVHTVITHKKNIFRKLGVSTAYEATRCALRAGLVEPVEYYI